MNFLPGSKGWIKKYFDLVSKGKIDTSVDLPEKVDLEAFMHAALGKTGIVFGYPSSLLFANDIDDSRWTSEEKLKLLLFEAHLFVYKIHKTEEEFTLEHFSEQLVAFYGQHNAYSISKLFTFFLKETQEEKLEDILSKRVDIRLNLLESKFWINYVSNVFIYLDVILFHQYLSEKKKSTIYHYDELAMNALTAITLASYSDGLIEEKERSMFKVFLASANLSDTHRSLAETRFENGGSFKDFNSQIKKSKLGKRFLVDLSAFVIFSNHEAVTKEKEFIKDLCDFLGFGEKELNESLALTEQFIINNHEKIPFLANSSSIEKVYGNLSKRWVKILGRNKDKLATELKQSKELVFLIKKSATTDLTKKEKEMVKEQFKDIVKSMPSLAIFLLPGGAFLLPLVLKVIPDLVPSAFRDNEVEKMK